MVTGISWRDEGQDGCVSSVVLKLSEVMVYELMLLAEMDMVSLYMRERGLENH